MIEYALRNILANGDKRFETCNLLWRVAGEVQKISTV